MRVFTVFCQKPLLRPFSDGHTCTAAQLIYMYSVLCLVYMTVGHKLAFAKAY